MNIWNSLPESVVCAPSVNAFKNRLDKFLDRQDIKYDYKAYLSTGKSLRRIIDVELDKEVLQT